MSKYEPQELKHLDESKRRIKQNVIRHFESPKKKPKINWTVGLVTVLLLGLSVFFTITTLTGQNAQTGLTPGKELPTAHPKPKPPVNKPEPPVIIEGSEFPQVVEKENRLYVNDITIGMTQEEVQAILGDAFELTEPPEDAWREDFGMQYGNMKISIYLDKVAFIVINDVNQPHFDELFESYRGERYIGWTDSSKQHIAVRLFYVPETAHELVASVEEDKGLTVRLDVTHGDFYTDIETAGIERVEDE
ncbi:hypothetical protein QWT69_04375 [Sporosarcina oncorhynchi]|uniref:Uncharacterized protein n=1 Tax=Sporosarcina oncorhynchi TaxID=3056444 RepID=A0ABZ0L730_9BACL|nr:hypothetical protein [Sporosarcina sp. T2O-4]WOV88366.1 hypothetical protein QWT69_04375 [Sporosarcina sp. T2O-4]